MSFLSRPRRNRKSSAIRNMMEETILLPQHLIYPLFLVPGEKQKIEIQTMPGVFRHSLDSIFSEIETCLKHGVSTFCLFPVVPESQKDKFAKESYNPKNHYLTSIREIKKRFPDAVVMTDVAMDPYSTDGHDGLVEGDEILNDASIEILVKMSLAQAQAGADIIGPSDMMDGRVRAIREALDKEHFTNVSIMSYTAKYASGFYGPFREALDSAPKKGDKKTYQMNPANSREALREAQLDESEGADFLMVKPALSYLDIISKLKEQSHLPIAAYNVSGEYAMVKFAARAGACNEKQVRDEILMSMRRAGADIILTYFAKDFALDFSQR